MDYLLQTKYKNIICIVYFARLQILYIICKVVALSEKIWRCCWTY